MSTSSPPSVVIHRSGFHSNAFGQYCGWVCIAMILGYVLVFAGTTIVRSPIWSRWGSLLVCLGRDKIGGNNRSVSS